MIERNELGQLLEAALTWQRELRETTTALRPGADKWRNHPDELRKAPEEAQWIDPAFGFALPQATLVLELATSLEVIANSLDEVVGTTRRQIDRET